MNHLCSGRDSPRLRPLIPRRGRVSRSCTPDEPLAAYCGRARVRPALGPRGGAMPIFEWRSVMPASADEVFAYHARPGAFQRLAPPWQKLKVLEESGDVTAGRVAFDVWFGPVRRHWVAEMGSA